MFQYAEIFFEVLPTFVLFPYTERSMNRDLDKLDRNSVTELNYNLMCIRKYKDDKTKKSKIK